MAKRHWNIIVMRILATSKKSHFPMVELFTKRMTDEKTIHFARKMVKVAHKGIKTKEVKDGKDFENSLKQRLTHYLYFREARQE